MAETACLLGNRKKIAKFLMRTFTCPSTLPLWCRQFYREEERRPKHKHCRRGIKVYFGGCTQAYSSTHSRACKAPSPPSRYFGGNRQWWGCTGSPALCACASPQSWRELVTIVRPGSTHGTPKCATQLKMKASTHVMAFIDFVLTASTCILLTCQWRSAQVHVAIWMSIVQMWESAFWNRDGVEGC
jgi:hypothetical protein